VENAITPAWIDAFLADEGLPSAYSQTIRLLIEPLADRIETGRCGKAYLVGLCGAQGSGKSTLTGALAKILESRGLTVATLSLDDFYLSHARRQDLARTIHPLLATRGVPGTHDPGACAEILDALRHPGPVRLPWFDKATDDPSPKTTWPQINAPVDVVLFEGWCVGARPQAAADLTAPINALERDEDPDGRWRGYVNAQLQGPYAALFSKFDLFVVLQAPGFEVVADWRLEQEDKLRRRRLAQGASVQGLMDEAAVRRFVAHYERVTRVLMAEAPMRADVLVTLQTDRTVGEIIFR